MKWYFISLVMCFLFPFTVLSQRLITPEEAAVGQYRKLAPQMLQNLQWQPNSDNVSYFKAKGEPVLFNIKKGKEEPFVSLAELNTALESNKIPKIKAIPYFTWDSENTFHLAVSSGWVRYNRKDKKIENYYPLPEGAGNEDFQPVSRFIAFTVKNNLFVCSPKGNIEIVTNDPDTGIVNGKTVHRNEFGIDKGTFWNNKGDKLAFYRMDESMVTNYPLVNIDSRVAEETPIRYPMAGMKSHQVSLGIFSLNSKKTVFLETGEPKEQYLTNISWSSDDKFICIAVLNREQNLMKFNQYDAVTGKFVRTIFEETNERYVEPLHPALFLKTDPAKFIWQSQRDGYNHLFLYDCNAGLVKQLTKGNWVVTELIGFDKTESVLYYMSTQKTALERHLYSLNIKTDDWDCLTDEPGTHEVVVRADGRYFIDNYSSLQVVNRCCVVDDKGKEVKELLNATDPLKEIAMPEMKMLEIKAADGVTPMYGRIIYPLNFDKTKKYPVIMYVYGGPHAQLVENSWLGGARLWDYYMAQKGYVVVTFDNRGSANRGFEFESVIHRRCGEQEALDQMEVVKYLKSQPWVDEKRMGVHGWSYGGFMTINLLATFPGVFKVGVAGGPVIDWKYYEVMYGERYMDMPQENAEGYEKTSLVNKAKNLKSKLLIIHGYIDDTVVPQHSLSFIQECITNNIPVDFFFFPKQPHNVRGMERVFLMDKITRYFDENL